jgi:REP element-mobilizing transposase RayT
MGAKVMARKKIPLTSEFPYHVMNRTNNRDWFVVSPNECWDIFCDFLFLVQRQYNLQIHLFILMSNHYHLLVSTPERNLSVAIGQWQSLVAKTINTEAGRSNHLFGGQYKASVIEQESYFYMCYQYLLRNPVRAGMIKSGEIYPFSTIAGEVGHNRLQVPIYQKLRESFISKDLISVLELGNQEMKEDHQEMVKRALMRTRFSLSSKRFSRHRTKVC